MKKKYIYYTLKSRIMRKLFYIAETALWRLGLPSKYGRLVSAWRRLMATGFSSLATPSTLASISLLKGVFAKNERGYRLNAIKRRF